MAELSTALRVAQNAAAIVGVHEPASLVGTRDTISRQLLALMNQGGRLLAQRRGPFGQCWPELSREHVVTLERGVEFYPLPDDYAGIVSQTTWDLSEFRASDGPLSPQEWQYVKSGQVEPIGLTKRYRVQLDPADSIVKFRIDPVPSQDGEDVRFEYSSFFWVRETAMGPVVRSDVGSNTHIPVFPANLMELDLIWRFRKARGLDIWRTDLAEFEVERDRAFAQAIELRDIRLSDSGRYGYGGRGPGDNVPERIPVEPEPPSPAPPTPEAGPSGRRELLGQVIVDFDDSTAKPLTGISIPESARWIVVVPEHAGINRAYDVWAETWRSSRVSAAAGDVLTNQNSIVLDRVFIAGGELAFRLSRSGNTPLLSHADPRDGPQIVRVFIAD